MPSYIVYDTATLQILQTFEGSTTTSIPWAEMFAALPAAHQALEISAEHPVVRLPGAWRIDAGALVQKATVTLTPDVVAFAADGSTECTITATGLTDDCFIRVNRVPAVLTVADPVLVLTSADPLAMTVSIEDPLHWGEDVTVEAV